MCIYIYIYIYTYDLWPVLFQKEELGIGELEDHEVAQSSLSSRRPELTDEIGPPDPQLEPQKTSLDKCNIN